ncbi:MAG TPA: UV DNA damage repair endonuclease UvsE [Longimicrobiales bacterium]
MPTAGRRIGFAVKVLGREGLRSHDTRRWQSNPSVEVSIAALHRILDYLDEVGIRMYRLSSDFVPYATHPDLPRFHHQIEAHAADLARIGRYARRLDIRLSLHPSQFVVLNAEDDAIARKSMWDLDVQARLLDAMEQGPEAVVVLHVGGVYGDRVAALERFVTNYARLSEPARRRLVIENDEACFTIDDCLWIHARIGIPVVFDHQHHRLNPGTLGTAEAARRALDTWPADVVPKLRFSSARLDGREVRRGGRVRVEAPLLRQHADYVDPWTFAGFLDRLRDRRFDVMLEAKAKDLAVLKLRDDLRTLGRAHVLHATSDRAATAAPPA